MKKKYLFNSLAFIFSLFLVIILIRQISFSNIKENFIKLTGYETAVISLFYISTLILRGIRYGFSVNLEGEGRSKFLAFSAIHSFLNHTLPFRLGETSLPFLFRMYTKKSFTAGMFSLIIVRLYDLVSVALFFIVSVIITLGTHENRVGLIPVITGAITLIVLSLIILYLPEVIQFLAGIGKKTALHAGKRGEKLSVRIDEVSIKIHDSFNMLSSADKLIKLPLVSIAMWFTIYYTFYLVMVYMDVPLGLAENIVASSGAVLTNLLPINGLGSFGTLEAGWTAGYTLFGIDIKDAISTGFIMHIIVVVTGFVTAALGALFLVIQKKSGKGN